LSSRSNRTTEDAKPPWLLIATVVLLVCLLITGGNLFLVHLTRQAEAEASLRMQLAAESTRQRAERVLDGYVHYFELLVERARLLETNRVEADYIELRLRELLGVGRGRVVGVIFEGQDGVPSWRWPASVDQLDAAALQEALRPPGETTRFGKPIPAGKPGSWLIPITRTIRTPTGKQAGVGLVLLDGALAGKALAGSGIRPDRYVGLWRGDGLLLTGNALAAEPVDKALVAPVLPDADGTKQMRMASLFDGEERFVALSRIPDSDLFVSVSSPVAVELADLQSQRLLVLTIEAIGAALAIGGGVLLFLLRARRRAQASLAAAEAAAAEARAREAELAHILDGVDAAVYRMRIGGEQAFDRYFVSAGAARLVRRPFEEVRQQSGLLAYAEPPVPPEDRDAAHAALAKDGRHTYERQVRCGDGQLRWLRFQLSVVDRDGDLLDCVGLVTDIETERAAGAAALAAGHLAMLGEISANLAHEMKQPLSVISLLAGTTQMMVEDPATADMAEIAGMQKTIVEMTQRATEITDHLRLVARKETASAQAIFLGEAVAGARLLTMSTLRQAGVTLEVALPDGLPPVLAQLVLLEQVLVNLIVNARDALATMPPGTRRIWITARPESERVRLVVTDSGPGIAPSVLPRLFEPFFTTKPAGLGTGLGLTICAGILQAFGGEITARNAPGRGAAFSLSLLLAPVTPAPPPPR